MSQRKIFDPFKYTYQKILEQASHFIGRKSKNEKGGIVVYNINVIIILLPLMIIKKNYSLKVPVSVSPLKSYVESINMN